MIIYRYHINILNISLGEKCELKEISPLFKNITIEQGEKGMVVVNVMKSLTWPESISKEEADGEVEELMDRLSLMDNHKIDGYKYIGYNDCNGNFRQADNSNGLSASLTAGIPNPKKYYELDRHKQILIGRINPGLSRIYRVAQSMPDGVGKFLLLYGALQVIFGETQKDVDNAIIRHRPDTQIVLGKHRSETIITRLRNEIAHPEDVDVDLLQSKSQSYCYMLSEMLRCEIINGIK